MNRYDHMRVLQDLAYQLDSGEPLSDEQRRYIAIAIYRISTGEDANRVFNVDSKKGHKLSDVISRRRMSMILHWVAGAIQPDPTCKEKPMSVEKACEQATTTIVPIAKAKYPGGDTHAYDAEYIMRRWHDAKYQHMQSPERNWFDPDFPYHPLPDVNDTK